MTIELARGKGVMKVSPEDFDWALRRRWRLDVEGYAVTGNRRFHTFIVELKPGEVTDHENRAKLDNRRSNLRAVTRGINNRNVARRRNNRSGMRGVFWAAGKWRVQLVVDKRCIHVGRFCNLADAIAARLMAEAEHLPPEAQCAP